MNEDNLLKLIESGGVVGLLIVGLVATAKIAKLLYDNQILALKEGKLNLQHLEKVAEKVGEVKTEIQESTQKIRGELEKQSLLAQSASSHHAALIKMLETIAIDKLQKVEDDLVEVKNNSEVVKELLIGARKRQLAAKEQNIRLKEQIKASDDLSWMK